MVMRIPRNRVPVAEPDPEPASVSISAPASMEDTGVGPDEEYESEPDSPEGDTSSSMLSGGPVFAATDSDFGGPGTNSQSEAIAMFGESIMAAAPFSVVYCDPPWPAMGGMPTPYPVMTQSGLLQFPIRAIIGDAVVLIMWSTWRHLEFAFKTMRAWGFEYSSGMPWLKTDQAGRPKYGMGLTFQSCTEVLLVGRRGNVGKLYAAANMVRVPRKGLVVARPLGHSQKPEEVATWVERSFPGPRIELFSRIRRPNWYAWGSDIGGAKGAGFGLDARTVAHDASAASSVITPKGGK